MSRFLLLTLTLFVASIALAQKPAKPLEYYLRGAVPERNGMVVFEDTFSLPHRSKAQIFASLQSLTQELIETKEKLKNSRITEQSEGEGVIAASIEEYLWFKRNAYVWDRALIRYQLIFQVEEGRFIATIRNIRYDYEGASTPGTDTHYKAEDWITDREALTSNGKKLTRVGGKKFRVRTIDRKDQIFTAAFQKSQNN